MDSKTKVFVILPLLSIVLLTMAGTLVPFSGDHTENERLLLGFVPAELTIHEKPGGSTFRSFTGLFDFTQAPAVTASGPGREGYGFSTNEDSRLTLTVVNGMKKMAILDGVLVKEGDRIDDKIIARIEPDRILIHDRFPQWIYLESKQ